MGASRIILVTGGCRSGKSAHAQALAEALPGPRAYVATCPVLDGEMRARIQRHREARAARDWQTVEEQTELAKVIGSRVNTRVFLIDCLTLWVNNLMYQAEQAGRVATEDDISKHCTELIDACRAADATVICVTNEVGMGIVPENALARRFRDLAGRCNQTVAAAADEVILMVAGVPVVVRESAAEQLPRRHKDTKTPRKLNVPPSCL